MSIERRRRRKKGVGPVRLIAESLAVGLAFCVLPLLPRRAVLWLATGLAGIAYRFCGGLRKIALANLDLAFGAGMDRAAKEAVARESFRTFTLVLIDLFWFALFRRRRVAACVTFDASCDWGFARRPLIVATGHLGNWEVMGHAAAQRGHPLMSVYVPLRNPVVDAWLRWIRRSSGQSVVARRGAVHAMLEVLRAGERVAVLTDQNILPRDGGEFIDFFGLPAPTSKIVGALSARSGAVVACVACTVDRRGHYTVRAAPPIEPAALGGDGAAITRAVMARVEAMVREWPGQWIWMYKRWKWVPPGAERGRFPFYSETAPPPRRQAPGSHGEKALAGGRLQP